MHKANMIAYVILSGAAPILVLMNSLFGTEAASSPATVQPLQSMRLIQRLMNSGPKNLVTADDLMPEVSVPYPHARIVIENHQAFLEFYSPFSMAAQTPNLLLVLDTAPVPSDTFFLSDRHPIISKLQLEAGKQRYPIPASVEVSQYLSLVIWCPESNAIMGYAPLTLEI
ncbi:MAG: DM13 domain-containing protein [Leptolyngbya sp. SIO1E4]|nr:DM13 domain-containing protein [Leptolyngbya sp. SIO1E4]